MKPLETEFCLETDEDQELLREILGPVARIEAPKESNNVSVLRRIHRRTKCPRSHCNRRDFEIKVSK